MQDDVLQNIILMLHLRHRNIQKYWVDIAMMVRLFGITWKTAR